MPGRKRDLYLMGVAMGVDTNDGVDDFCHHGQRPVPHFPGRGSTSAPAWVESPSGTSVTGHAIGGQASDQANLMGQAGAGNHSGRVVSKARQSGQIYRESRWVTDTKPAGPPPRSTATTLTDLPLRWITTPKTVTPRRRPDHTGP